MFFVWSICVPLQHGTARQLLPQLRRENGRQRMNPNEIKLPAELYTFEALPDGRVITYCTMRQEILHCIGMIDSGSQRHRPYRRHGKIFYRPWRNYFCSAADDQTWNRLCEAGYAAHGDIHAHDGRKPSTTFWMTRAGLDWLGREIGMTIYDEED